MDIMYTVKAGDSTSSIAAKFGKAGRENELIAYNIQMPKRTVYHMGKAHVVFADLVIGQKIRIPNSWVNRGTGYKSSSNLIPPTLQGVGRAVQCPPGYVYNAKMGVCVPQGVGVGKTVQCPQGYVYNAKMGVCVPKTVGVNGVGQLGAAEGEACGISNFAACDSGLECSGYYDGICQKTVSSEETYNTSVPQGGYCDSFNWCGTGLTCKNGTCQPDTGQTAWGYCVSDSMCGYGEYCNNGTCEKIQGIPKAEPVIKEVVDQILCYPDVAYCNNDSECCSGYCEPNPNLPNGIKGQCWTPGKEIDGEIIPIDKCNDPASIEKMYTALGEAYPAISGYGNYGEWNEALQAALEATGMTYEQYYSLINKDVPCDGNAPSPVYCSSGQKFNLDTGKCEVIGGGTKKPPSCATGYQLNAQGTACVKIGNSDVTPVVDKDEVEKKEEGFPWGWALLGAVVVVGGGTAIYYATKKPDKSKSSSPVAKKPVTVSERMRRRY